MSQVKRYLFKDSPDHDTCWDIASSPDGYIYIGACMEHTPGGIAELVQFNPKDEKLKVVAKMSDITGEKYGDFHAPQGKIHLSLCPDSAGIVYGSTHCTTPPATDKMWDPWAMFYDFKRSFNGAHFYKYDPKKDDTEDFGVVVPNEGVSVMLYEENIDKFFAASFPKSHLYSWDSKGRNIIDFGRVSEHYILSLIKYDDGQIYFTDYYGKLISIDPQKMKLSFLEVLMPHPSYNDGMRNWMSHNVLGDDGWIYTGMYSYPNLIRFRPEKDKVIIEDLGKGTEDTSKDKALDFAYAKGAPAGLIFKNGYIFYIQLVYLGPKEFVGCYVTSFNTKNGKKEYICQLKSDDGFKPLVWKGVLGVDGKLYWADFDAVPPSLWSLSL